MHVKHVVGTYLFLIMKNITLTFETLRFIVRNSYNIFTSR